MNNNELSNIRMVLVHTTHPGNIGAAARAMKNMGLADLCLVSPAHFPDPEATSRAAGADDVLENALIKPNVSEAIEDCHWVIGASARLRTLPLPLLNPKTCAELLFSKERQGRKVAILFGTERTGLTNEDLLRCNYHLHVPTVPDFFSLNVASALQIVAYEIRMAFLSYQEKTESLDVNVNQDMNEMPAGAGEIERFYAHFQQMLEHLDFLKPPHCEQVMNRIRRLFNRAALETRELNILRGILSAIEKRK